MGIEGGKLGVAKGGIERRDTPIFPCGLGLTLEIYEKAEKGLNVTGGGREGGGEKAGICLYMQGWSDCGSMYMRIGKNRAERKLQHSF